MQLFTTSARNRLHALAPRAANFNLTENGDIFLSSLFFMGEFRRVRSCREEQAHRPTSETAHRWP